MYTAATVTDFNQRVDLGNSYCNCFYLMCCVEESPWYIEQKKLVTVIHRVKVLDTTNSLALRAFNTVDRCFFSCDMPIIIDTTFDPYCVTYQQINYLQSIGTLSKSCYSIR